MGHVCNVPVRLARLQTCPPGLLLSPKRHFDIAMTRIFTTLAVVLTVALASAFVGGFVTMALDLPPGDVLFRFGLGLVIFLGFVLVHVVLMAARGRAKDLLPELRLPLTLVPLALLAALAAGWLAKSLEPLPSKHALYLVHFLCGLFTALGVLFVHCIVFTYFLGTGRWVKEVGLAYELPDAALPRETRELKRTAFPAALRAMLIVIAAVAAGAGRQLTGWHWTIHYSLAIATMHLNLCAFVVEYRCLSRNADVIAAVLDEVDRIRAERGLPSNAEAL